MKEVIKWLRNLGVYLMLSSSGYCLWYLSKAEEFFMWLFLIGCGLYYFAKLWEKNT